MNLGIADHTKYIQIGYDVGPKSFSRILEDNIFSLFNYRKSDTVLGLCEVLENSQAPKSLSNSIQSPVSIIFINKII